MSDEWIVDRQLSLESHNHALHRQLFYLAESEILLKTYATNSKLLSNYIYSTVCKSDLHLNQQAIFIRCVRRLGVSKS
jgi:hypothetical protein